MVPADTPVSKETFHQYCLGKSSVPIKRHFRSLTLDAT